jgi:hypothetical protein
MTDNNINNNEEEDLLSVNLSRRRSLQSNNNNNNNSRKSSSKSLQHYGQSIINNNNNSQRSNDIRKKNDYIVNRSFDGIGLSKLNRNEQFQLSNVDKAKKVINDNNLFKLKDVYMKSTSLNNSKEQLQTK